MDQYENTRPERRTHFEMVLPRTVRQDMLREEWQVTQSQIAAAIRQNIKIKNQRRTTVNNLGKVTDKMEEKMESMGKKFKLWRRSTGKETEKLLRRSEAVQQRMQEQKVLHVKRLLTTDLNDEEDYQIMEEDASEAIVEESEYSVASH